MSLEKFHTEIKNGQRFEFGKNWKKFLTTLNDERIRQAELSLKTMLLLESLEGKTLPGIKALT